MILYFPFDKDVSDYYARTSTGTGGTYKQGKNDYCISYGVVLISIKSSTNLASYFTSHNQFSIDFWFQSNDSYFEDDATFDIQFVSESTVVLEVKTELMGSSKYISLYDNTGYICQGFSTANVLDSEWHHIAFQLTGEDGILDMFEDGKKLNSESGVVFKPFSDKIDTINIQVRGKGSTTIALDDFRIMDGLNFTDGFDISDLTYPE